MPNIDVVEAPRALPLPVLLLLFGSGCGLREIDPPKAPAQEMPQYVEARSTPPEPGTTRLILDANGERATVTEVIEAKAAVGTAKADGITAMVSSYSETTAPVCIAPCVVDLKPGLHVLRFTAEKHTRNEANTSDVNVQVGEQSKVVRHAIGKTEGASWNHVLAMTAFSLAVAAAGTGALFMALNQVSESSAGKAAPLLLASGVGGLVVTIPWMVLSRPVHQPGSTTEVKIAKR